MAKAMGTLRPLRVISISERYFVQLWSSVQRQVIAFSLADIMAGDGVGDGAGGPVILEDEELLRKLAKIIYYQEVEAIKNIGFKSEYELAKNLRDSKANYKSVLSLLDTSVELKRKFDDDKDKARFVHDVFSYIVTSVDYALQVVKNYTLRLNYLNKISEHLKSIANAVNTSNVAEVESLAKEVALCRDATLEVTKMHRSTASRNFSRNLKETGLKLDELVQRYKVKLEFDGQFKDLEVEQKLQVYDKIIEESGRGKVKANEFSNEMENAGKVVLLFTTGMMVWDIFSSEHILEAATHEAVVAVASEGGAMLGEVIGAALATELAGGVEASAVFVVMAATVGSIAGAFIIGAFAGWLIDLIIHSGGTAPFSTDGYKCYVVPLPDGMALARQIAHA